jgi:hypothetical protein
MRVRNRNETTDKPKTYYAGQDGIMFLMFQSPQIIATAIVIFSGPCVHREDLQLGTGLGLLN